MMTQVFKHYHGTRTPREAGPAVVTVNGQPLNPRNDLRNHSPDGFQWGYGGSGPAQLALALVADATRSDAVAVLWYQRFKAGVIAGFQADDWYLTDAEIIDWITEKMTEEPDILGE